MRVCLKSILVWLALVLLAANVRAATIDEIRQMVEDGHWAQARQEIAQGLAATNLSFAAREDLMFQSDRMHRMWLDFHRTRENVLDNVRNLAPAITDAQFANWEQSGAVEYLEVDGTRRYFGSAARNLFHINADARALLTPAATNDLFGTPNYRMEDIREILTNYDRTGQVLGTPRKWRVTYEITVHPGAVAPGETVRAWLPFPHVMNRQSDIRLVSTDPARNLISSPTDAIASVYLEKTAPADGPTVFSEVFECTSRAYYQPIDPARVVAVDTNDPALAPYLGERPPHIVFSDEIKNLTQQIVGPETNPYLKARRIFQWVFEHVVWASAREYSTVDCIPHYAITHGHGDCGMEAMTFMTLCRCAGIPAHWESGWVSGPDKDMHDWCEIYLAPYGWVPVDVCYGLINSPSDREKWFYLGGIDEFRMVVNMDHGQPLYPVKTAFRSEIVDFQRGEVEWRGGNLYFNQWDWGYDVTEVAN